MNSDKPQFRQMSGHETWSALSSYAWGLHPGANKPTLVQAWQRREDGLIRWEQLRTVALDELGYEVRPEAKSD